MTEFALDRKILGLWASELDPAELRILLMLYADADPDTLDLSISIDALASRAGVSRRTIERSIDSLEEKGRLSAKRTGRESIFRLIEPADQRPRITVMTYLSQQIRQNVKGNLADASNMTHDIERDTPKQPTQIRHGDASDASLTTYPSRQTGRIGSPASIARAPASEFKTPSPSGSKMNQQQQQQRTETPPSGVAVAVAVASPDRAEWGCEAEAAAVALFAQCASRKGVASMTQARGLVRRFGVAACVAAVKRADVMHRERGEVIGGGMLTILCEECAKESTARKATGGTQRDARTRAEREADERAALVAGKARKIAPTGLTAGAKP